MQAQWEAPLSHYWEIRGYYNPSFVGAADQFSTTVLYRYQWRGIDEAPQRAVLTAEIPFRLLNRRHGVGIASYTEGIGTLRNTFIGAQYSFKYQIGNGLINFGLQAGIYNLNYDAEAVAVNSDSLLKTTNATIISSPDKKVADFGAGISWTNNRFYAGLSVMHLNQPEFYISSRSINNPLESDSLKSHIPRTYNFIARYNISLFHSLELQPMILLQSNSSMSYTQATMRLEYDKKYSGGFSWISEDIYSFFAGVVLESFRFGYAYSNRSHELYINYHLPIYIFKPKVQPQKSIRLL